jgi:hypothetical protein
MVVATEPRDVVTLEAGPSHPSRQGSDVGGRRIVVITGPRRRGVALGPHQQLLAALDGVGVGLVVEERRLRSASPWSDATDCRRLISVSRCR